ncbi:hypothetical protein AVEN_185697-1 [Araneus ventricosus]|uniref:Uncharacterized protein n=1 Tax=Araneus ventricosus TaxID=182803 RepID=A0A4Y2NBF1_ARAVE|nr:hypothetical protein AVEN_185697-1 [Araneus ventricosus]
MAKKRFHLASNFIGKVDEDPVSYFLFLFLVKRDPFVLYSRPFPLVRDDTNKECDCERRTFVRKGLSLLHSINKTSLGCRLPIHVSYSIWEWWLVPNLCLFYARMPLALKFLDNE